MVTPTERLMTVNDRVTPKQISRLVLRGKRRGRPALRQTSRTLWLVAVTTGEIVMIGIVRVSKRRTFDGSAKEQCEQ